MQRSVSIFCNQSTRVCLDTVSNFSGRPDALFVLFQETFLSMPGVPILQCQHSCRRCFGTETKLNGYYVSPNRKQNRNCILLTIIKQCSCYTHDRFGRKRKQMKSIFFLACQFVTTTGEFCLIGHWTCPNQLQISNRAIITGQSVTVYFLSIRSRAE